MGRCKAKTKSGNRCKRPALPRERFCKQHLADFTKQLDSEDITLEEELEVIEEIEVEEDWTLDIPKEEFIEHLSALGIKADKSMSQEQLEKLFEDYQKEQAGVPTTVSEEEWDSFPKEPIQKKKGPEGFYYVKPELPTSIPMKDIETLVIREEEIVVILKAGPKWRWET